MIVETEEIYKQNGAVVPPSIDPDLDDMIDPDAWPDEAPCNVEEVLQPILIAAIVQDLELCKHCRLHLPYKAFVSKGHQTLARFAYEYQEKYGTLPPLAFAIAEAKAALEGNKSLLAHLGEINTAYIYSEPSLHSRDYIKSKILEMAQRRAVAQAVIEYQKSLETGKPDFAALSAAIQKVPGTGDRKRKALSYEELLALPPTKWLVKGQLPLNSFVCVYGPPGIYKSFYCLDVALSVATGRKLYGQWETVQGPALYIAAEGEGGIPKRCKAWAGKHGYEKLPNFRAICAAFNLKEAAEAQAILDEAWQAFGAWPAVIVVDTLNRNLIGSESKDEDMAAFIANIDFLRQTTKATIIVVHHTGKDITRKARGHSSLPGANDVIIEGRKGDEGRIELVCEKQKDAEPFKSFQLVANKVAVGVDEDGEEVTSLVLSFDGIVSDLLHSKKEDAVIAKLTEMLGKLPSNPDEAVCYLGAAQLLGLDVGPLDEESKAREKARSMLRDNFEEAESRLFITSTGRGVKGKPQKWHLTDHGQAQVVRTQALLSVA